MRRRSRPSGGRLHRRLEQAGLLAAPLEARRAAAGLSEVLASLGPVYGALAAYLASRCDCLPTAACLQLAGGGGRRVRRPFRAVRSQLRAVLGEPVESCFRDLDPEPSRLTAFEQHHQGLWSDGRPVTVRVRLPWLEEAHEELVAELPALGRMRLTDGDLGGALAGAGRWLAGQIDLRGQARTLEALQPEEPPGELLAPAPAPVAAPGRSVLIQERFAGRPAHEALAGGGVDLARRLALAWLTHLISLSSVAEGPLEHYATFDDDGRIVFTGGIFTMLEAPRAIDLLAYLLAVVRDDPERAWPLLRDGLAAAPSGPQEESLLHELRHAVPFTAASWLRSETVPRCSEALFQQLRCARRAGYPPGEALVSLARGLSQLTLLLRDSGDILEEAVVDVATLGSLVEARRALGPSRLLAGIVERLPQVLERLDPVGTEGTKAPATEARAPAERRWHRFGGLLAVWLATALSADRLAEDGGVAAVIAAAAFGALSLYLLWYADRGRGERRQR